MEKEKNCIQYIPNEETDFEVEYPPVFRETDISRLRCKGTYPFAQYVYTVVYYGVVMLNDEI